MYSAIQHVRRQLCLTGYIKNKLTNIFLKENFWEMFFLQLTYFFKNPVEVHLHIQHSTFATNAQSV